jgi:hypothetical protein
MAESLSSVLRGNESGFDTEFGVNYATGTAHDQPNRPIKLDSEHVLGRGERQRLALRIIRARGHTGLLIEEPKTNIRRSAR